MVRHDAVALRVCIDSVILSGRMAIDGDAEVNRLLSAAGTEYKMKIASMKAKHNLAARGLERGYLLVVDPFAGKSPLIQVRMLGCGIELFHIFTDAAGRSKVLRARVSDIGLR